MAVKNYARRQYRHGDRRWRVQWFPTPVLTEFGDLDIDACPTYERVFDNEPAAAKFAIRVAPVCIFGVVEYWYEEFMPYESDPQYQTVGFWEAIGETVYVEPEGSSP